jgi:alpha-D-ribose 1-methylphosphonate 5-triphosphate diphosphatase
MMDNEFLILGGTCLTHGEEGPGTWSKAAVSLSNAFISRIGPEAAPADTSHATVFDAGGLLVLPGIVDIHGDAFERQIQPRPETVFAHDIALADTDRQLAANGITTACHGVTYSWEGGLRGREAALELMEQVEAQRAFAHADHRIHLRFECHHIDGLQDALAWISEGRVDIVAFNEHLPAIAKKCARPEKLAAYAERARCDSATFRQRLQDAQAGSEHVERVIATIAAACRERGIPMASHDDETESDRERFQELGAFISEFPRTQDALFRAMALDNSTIMGAPNVLLGGSHCGGLAAIDAVRSRMCDILASDYYYPSLLHAPFKLAFHGACSLAEAWQLVSGNPAAALRLSDRGRIADGARADLILVEQRPEGKVRLIATIAAGKLAYCAEPERLVMRQAHRLAA